MDRTAAQTSKQISRKKCPKIDSIVADKHWWLINSSEDTILDCNILEVSDVVKRSGRPVIAFVLDDRYSALRT